MKAKLASRRAVFLIIGGDVLLLLLGWMLLVSPQRQTAASIARATQAAEVQIQEAQRLSQAAAAPVTVPKQPQIRTASLYELAKAMPTTTDMPDVLLELDQVARAAGVTVNSITPGGVSAGNGFGMFPINITFAGDFYSLTDLLYRLRTLVTVRHGELDASGRLFSVDMVGLSPAAGSGQLTASVTVSAFVYGASSATPQPLVTPLSTDTSSTGTTTPTTTPAPSADAAP